MLSLATTSAWQVPSRQGRRIWIDTDSLLRSRAVPRFSLAGAGSSRLFDMDLFTSVNNEALQRIVERDTVIYNHGTALNDPLGQVLG